MYANQQKRKENESKRAQYLAEIDRHKLSESHQQLMVSTRDQGQKHTSRWRLKMIIRRHKAGLTLTEEETSLLLPYMDSQLEDSSDEDKGPSKKSRAAAPTAPAAPTALAALAPAVIDPTTAALSVSAAPPVEVPVPDDGLTPGQRLMAQFRQLQSKVAADNANREVIEAAPEIDIAAEFAAKRQPHVIATGPDAMERLMAGHKDGRCTVPSVPSTRKRFDVRRDDAIQLARMQLPVCGMEQEIVEAINANDAVILCGETGSGKSTQVPQFLYEAGYCAEEGVRIGITQPRRVAASSTALRVAVEMNCPIGGPNASETDDAKEDGKKKKKKRKRQPLDGRSPQLVGYQVRHDASTVTTETCIKYMTDGILLREVTSDLLLRQYSAIILDEAHERNVNTDVLLGMLSRYGVPFASYWPL